MSVAVVASKTVQVAQLLCVLCAMPSVCFVRLSDIAMAKEAEAAKALEAADRARALLESAHRTWTLTSATCELVVGEWRVADMKARAAPGAADRATQPATTERVAADRARELLASAHRTWRKTSEACDLVVGEWLVADMKARAARGAADRAT